MEKDLYKLLSALHHASIDLNELLIETHPKRRVQESEKDQFKSRIEFDDIIKQQYGDPNLHVRNLDILYDTLGFCIERRESVIPGGGRGVVVSKGTIPAGTVVSMYPGMCRFMGFEVFGMKHFAFCFTFLHTRVLSGQRLEG